ncbi:MAG: hypothetical protein IPO92_17295 [Saprospiraceae bacterium]|nr:hypothetical protein [Saprospiraceae bacterium]
MRNILIPLCLIFVVLVSSTTSLKAIMYTVTTVTDFPVSGGVTTATGVIIGGAGAGQVSLRSAIIASNANVGADIILFNVSTNGTPFTLAIAGANENGALTGDLDILDALTITGNGPANTIIQAGTNNTNGIDKVFSINPLFTTPFATTISGITIRFGKNPSLFSGDGFGGGLDWEGSGTGTLLIDNCIITDNKPPMVEAD